MIGILTFNRAINYGAVLQAYALKTTICKYESCEIINYKCLPIEKAYQPFNKGWLKGIIYWLEYHKKSKKFHKFIVGMSTNRIFHKNDIANINYDKIVVGSDQVWNFQCSGNDESFLLPNSDKKKYSYAASFGTSTLQKGLVGYFRENIQRFRLVSVREKTGQSICRNELGLNAEIVLDPTLLLTQYEWAKKFNLADNNEKYILVYSLGLTSRLKNMAKAVSKELGLPIYNISTSAKDFFGDKVIKNASPQEWVELFYNAKFVVTDSFHGTAFSINFNKPFYAFANNDRASRIVDLLDTLGLQNRLNLTLEEVDPETEIDYVSVNEKLEVERKKSIAFIEKIIND